MTQNYRCGDYAALMGYLYDDCEAGEREAIAVHLQSCRACADELAALTGTRRQLASWAPPDTRLGFQITPAGADESRVIRLGSGKIGAASTAWWRQPLPAWAQMAAAMLIFTAGLSIGMARGTAAPAAGSESPEVRAALSDLRQRVSHVEQLSKRGGDGRVTVAHAVPSEAEILQRVRYDIARSEERQRQEWQSEVAIGVIGVANTQQARVAQVETNLMKAQMKAQNEFENRLQQMAFSGVPPR